MNPKKYSDDEAREILKRAVDYQTQDDFQYSREQLLDMGREMGLSEAAIVKAEQERVVQGKTETPVSARLASTVEIPVEQLEMEFRRHRWSDFRQQLFTYAVVIGFLFLINLVTIGLRPPWFIFPAGGWGMALAFQAYALRNNDGDEYEKAFDNWIEKREKRTRKRRRRLERDREEII